MAITLRIPVLLAGAIASAIALAPAAAADPGTDDTAGSSSVTASDSRSAAAAGANRGSARNSPDKGQLSSDFADGDLPTGWTNEAQWARPGLPNPLGSGPKPPILALD